MSASFRLYSSHLKQYFGIALKAFLWVLLPVYGWAKYSALMALISRLAFRELINQPESVSTAHQRTDARKWRFLIAGILVLLLTLGVVLVYILVVTVVVGVLSVSISGLLTSFLGAILVGVLGIVTFVGFILVLLWLTSRLLVTEVPLAIEDNLGAVKTISRSWDLSEKLVWQIIGIVSVAFLITIPIQLLFSVISGVLQTLLEQTLSANALIPVGVMSILLNLLGGAIVAPFWQALKAVVYYDLRSRREGLGLKLRDR
ncbi:DUF975 domain-containing protein [Trichocoleus desertorum AS-A10]|uniref:DUF975 domain-containing protein n=1 Tax=Trichocoleus desertorum TaxID=1481672 RepID=UPI00329A1598